MSASVARPYVVGYLINYPLTAPGVVTRIFTDLATITVDDGVIVEEVTAGVTLEYLQSVTRGQRRSLRIVYL